MVADGYIQLPTDGTGKKTRNVVETIGADDVYSQVIRNSDSSGTIINPATSDKQLPNDHDVTVSNMIAEVETGLAKDATLTDASQVTKLNVNSSEVSTSNPLPVQLPGLQLPICDTINVSYPTDSTEVYEYVLYGLTVATVTVTYTNSTKVYLTSVVRT